MNDVALRVLKTDLEPDMLAKFEAKVAELQKDGEAMDPALKQALKGMLQLMASFKDKLQTPQLQALAHLVGFTGQQMAGDNSANADDGDDDTDMDSDNDDDGDLADTSDGDSPFAASADPTGKDSAQDPTAPNDPNAKPNPFGKSRGGKMNAELAAFKKAADAEAQRLRKEQDSLRKANEKMQAQLRKQEVSALVAKKYPSLGGNDDITNMVMSLEKAGLMTDQLEQRLSAWNEQLSQGGLFEELGKAGHAEESSPEGQLDALAVDLMKADATGRLSYEQAYSRAAEQHPEIRHEMQKRDRQRLHGQRA